MPAAIGEDNRTLAFPQLENKYATLQKPEGSPWHAQGLHIAAFRA